MYIPRTILVFAIILLYSEQCNSLNPPVKAPGVEDFCNGRFEEALQQFRREAKSGKDSDYTDKINYYLARSELDLNEITEILQDFSTRSPFYSNAKFLQGHLKLACGDYGKAVEAFEELAERGEGWYELGTIWAARVFIMMGRQGEAARSLAKLTGEEISSAGRAEAMELSAELHLMKSELDQAIRLCREILTISSESYDASGLVTVLMRCRKRAGDPATVDPLLKKAIALSDESMSSISANITLYQEKRKEKTSGQDSVETTDELFYVHLGSFLELEKADSFKVGLSKRGRKVELEEKNIGDKILYQVWLKEPLREYEAWETGEELRINEGIRFRLVPFEDR